MWTYINTLTIKQKIQSSTSLCSTEYDFLNFVSRSPDGAQNDTNMMLSSIVCKYALHFHFGKKCNDSESWNLSTNGHNKSQSSSLYDFRRKLSAHNTCL